MKAGLGLMAAVCVAATGCGTAHVSLLDPDIRGMSEAARSAYNSGQVGRAAELYRSALERARLTDSRGEVARTAYNLALCRLAMGRADDARQLLVQAEALLPGDSEEAARVTMAFAEAAAAMERFDEAAAAVRRITSGKADGETEVQAHLLLAEMARRSGDQAACASECERAASGLAKSANPFLHARSDAIDAWLASKAGRHVEAGRELESQAGWLGRGGRYAAMAGVLAEAAEAFEAGGELVPAADCRLRAVQSMVAQGDKASAVALLRRTVEFTRKSGDDRHRRQAEALMAELGVGP